MSRGILVVWLIFLYCVLCLVDCKLLDNVCHKDDLDCLHPNIDATGKLVHGKCLAGNTLRRQLDVSLLECVRECMVTSQCTGINYRKNWKLCDVTSNVSGTFKLVDEKDCMYSDIGSWSKKLAGQCSHHNCPEGTSCKVGTTGPVECTETYCKGLPETPQNAHSIEKFGLYRSVGQGNKFSCDANFTLRGQPFVVCTKTGEWTTLFCCLENSLPTDCGDLPRSCHSGVYRIYPSTSSNFDVYCDMEEDGGVWTVLVRRVDGSENFVRNWKEYANGFGDLEREFWLGNEQMHRLTSKGRVELMVNLKNFKNEKRFANYSTFKVGNAASKYTLTVAGYSGDAGDALSRHNGQKFTTADSDNDNSNNYNCASRRDRIGSGWWYNNCELVSFTLHYATNKDYSREQLIQWQKWSGSKYSIKQATMKIRRS